MRVLVLAAQKGGTGKTTLATSLAVAAREAGLRAALLDVDPQGTASAWGRLRKAPDPQVMRAQTAHVAAMVDGMRAAYDLLVVDTPGSRSATNAALRSGHLCLAPCRPSPADVLAAAGMAETAETLGRPAAFVVSQAPARGPRASEAREALELSGEVAPGVIGSRVAFADAFGLGLGVTEYEPKGRAATELRSLWQWAWRRIRT